MPIEVVISYHNSPKQKGLFGDTPFDQSFAEGFIIAGQFQFVNFNTSKTNLKEQLTVAQGRLTDIFRGPTGDLYGHLPLSAPSNWFHYGYCEFEQTYWFSKVLGWF